MATELKELNQLIKQKACAIAKAVHTEIVRRTPIDSGQAKANWYIDFAPHEGTIKPAGNLSAGSAESIARARQDAITPTKMGSNKSIYVFNNLPYIGKLEHGSSTQAPNGMVRGAIDKVTGGIQ